MSGDFGEANGAPFITNPMLCEETSHEGEELRYFCKEESCRRCICQQCTASHHEHHQLQSLEEAGKHMKEILEKDVNRAKQLREKCEQELEQSKKDMERIQREIDVAKKEVDDAVEMIQKMAIEHGRVMKHQLDQTLQEQKTARDDEQTEINTGIKLMSELCHQLQALKDTEVSNEMTNNDKLFQKRRELLSQTPRACDKPVVSNVAVHYVTNQQVMQSLEDVGKIVKSVTDLSQSNIEFKMARNAERGVCPTGISAGNELRKGECDEEPTNSPLLNPVKAFGEYGSGKGQLNGPRSIAVSDNGRLAIAECDNHRIQIFSPIEGKCLEEFGEKGQGEGQLLWPCGVVFNEDRIIVTDGRDGKGRIQEFNLNGSYVRTIYARPDLWFAPRGMCANDDKNIAVCCWGNEELGIIPSIRVFSNKGLMLLLEEFCMDDYDEQPWYVTYGNGKYFVSYYDQNYVHVFDKNGVFLYKFGEQGMKGGQFNGVRGLAVYGPDRILVCDFDNHRVQLLTQEGDFLNSFGSYGSGDGQMDSPTDLVVTSDGGVFVTEWFNQRIQFWC